MLGVIGEQLEGDTFERGSGRVDLGEDVDTVTILLNHVLDATHLTFDTPKPCRDLLLVLRVTSHQRIIPPMGIVVW